MAQSDIFATRKHDVVVGICWWRFIIRRRSWLCEWVLMKVPAQMNINALNIACVIRWKSASDGKFMASLVIITLSCLNVDNAITFFMSYSIVADNPDINIVIELIKRIIKLIFGEENKNSENRICRKIPAVTSVEEWTNADTGVGAAIAAGNQLENGICALFVNLAVNNIRLINIKYLFSHGWE